MIKAVFQLFSLLLQKGELVKIFAKYLKEDESPTQNKKIEISESRAGEDILQAFNEYMYKKHNCEAFNKSSFIAYKTKTGLTHNFSSLLSINEENGNERLNTLNSYNDIVNDNTTSNKNRSSALKSLSPYQGSRLMPTNKTSMTFQADSLKNPSVYLTGAGSEPHKSRVISRILTKTTIPPVGRSGNKKDDSQPNLSDSKCFTTNKCNIHPSTSFHSSPS